MPSILTNPTDNRRLALTLVILWCGAIFLAMLLPQERLWGINLLAFASTEVRLGFACAAALALILTAARIRPPAPTHRPKSLIYPLLIVIAIGACAWGLRAQEALLGDGTLRANHALQPKSTLPSEILPTALAAALVQTAPATWRVDGFQAYRLISVATTIALVTFLWWFAPLALGTRGHSLLLWILTFGSVRLFAGYIETYTLAFAFSCCWTLSAWGYLNRRVRSIWMFAFWALALLSHVTAVLLLPASLWVLSRTDDGRVSLKGRELLGFALVALAIGGVVVFAFFRTQVERVGAGTGHFLMSITSEPPHRYGLFSSAHLADFINHWLLLAPAFVVVGLALAIQSARSKLFNIRDYLSHDLLFWTLAAFAPIAAGFIIDPKLGWARDWDLFTLLSAPALTGIAIWLTRLTGPLKRAALSIAFLSAGLWLTFSVDGNAERRRFEALLDLDQSRSDYGHEILAQYYQRIGDSEGTLRHYRAALLVSENIRYRVNIAVAYFDMRKYDEAEVWGRGVIARDPNNASAHHGLSLVLTATERPMEALDHSARAVTLDPRQPDYAMQYALVLVELERYAEALPLLRRVAQSSPREAAPLNVLSVCYLALDSAAAAKAYALAALRVAPEEAMIWLNAASAAFREHSWHESARYLLEYKKRVPDSALHPEAQAMLDSLSQLPEPL